VDSLRYRVPRPEIIAHRGASRERPENTLAAFERAGELGAGGVELDIHLHPDGILRVHHDPFPPGREPTGAAPPTLEDSLRVIMGAGLTAYCELKGAGTAAGTLSAILDHGGNGAVHSFDHRLIAEARRIAPAIARGVLEVSYPVDPLHALEMVGGRDLWRQWPFVDEALVRAAHATGARVIAWTVNDPAVMERLASIGVDGLCTDDPALARRVLGS
jgi:glycerophosphoryl diester phosphodiesterase